MINRRNPRPRAFAPDPDAPPVTCEMPGCDEPAGYRAPRSRTELNSYRWFCLEHVRAYNGSWDFYKGMTPGQIEAQIRADARWQRPSWPLGRNGSGGVGIDEETLRDPLGVLHSGGIGVGLRRDGREGDAAASASPPPPPLLREPLGALGLPWPVSLDEVKSRWKALAKRYHPDQNHGDRDAEERLKSINLAYSTIRRHLDGSGPAAAGHAPQR